MLNVSPACIQAWLFRRKINSYRIGRAVRIPVEEVDRILHDGLRPAVRLQRKG